MKDIQRELFGNNKIKEVLCQFSFKQHLEPNSLSSLKEILSVNYPVVHELPLIHFNFKNPNENPDKLDFNGYRVLNDKGDKIVQIFTDNISIHQVGNYQQWEVFRNDIYFVIETLKKVVDAEVGRIDIRAINIFEFEENFKPQDYFNLALVYPDSLVQQSNYSFQLEQVYESGKKIGVVRGNYVNDQKKIEFIFDLTHVQLLLDSTVNISDDLVIKKSLEEGHLALYKLFLEAITEKTKKLIK